MKTRASSEPRGGTEGLAGKLARAGRGGDEHFGHLSPGEIVVPNEAIEFLRRTNPGVLALLAGAIRQGRGLDPRAFVVGHPMNRVHPSGAYEFNGAAGEGGSAGGGSGGGDLGGATGDPPGHGLGDVSGRPGSSPGMGGATGDPPGMGPGQISTRPGTSPVGGTMESGIGFADVVNAILNPVSTIATTLPPSMQNTKTIMSAFGDLGPLSPVGAMMTALGIGTGLVADVLGAERDADQSGPDPTGRGGGVRVPSQGISLAATPINQSVSMRTALTQRGRAAAGRG